MWFQQGLISFQANVTEASVHGCLRQERRNTNFSPTYVSVKSSEAPFAVKILATKPTSVSELKLSCRAGYSGMSAVIPYIGQILRDNKM